MPSDDDRKPPVTRNTSTSFKLLIPLAILSIVIFIALISKMSGYLLRITTNRNIPQATQRVSFQSSPTASGYALDFRQNAAHIPAVSPYEPTPSDTYAVSSWKMFISPMEGFTIRYPDNWHIEDQTLNNCGYKTGILGLHSNDGHCRDNYTFISPDGLVVRYVIYGDRYSDKASCGIHIPCGQGQYVDAIEDIYVAGLGEVMLVKSATRVFLHKPTSSETIPSVGLNKHSSYDIDFTMPSKFGGRFSIGFTGSYPSSPAFSNLPQAKFYTQKSVKQAIVMLKSMEY